MPPIQKDHFYRQAFSEGFDLTNLELLDGLSNPSNFDVIWKANAREYGSNQTHVVSIGFLATIGTTGCVFDVPDLNLAANGSSDPSRRRMERHILGRVSRRTYLCLVY